MATGRRRGRTLTLVLLLLIFLVIVGAAVAYMSGMIPGVGKQVNTPGDNAPVPGIGSTDATATPIPEEVSIFVVSQDIRRGQEIDPARVVLTKIKRDEDSETYFHNTDEKSLIGSRALVDLKPSTVLTNDMVAAKGSNPGIPSFDVPSGMVAISVPLSKLSAVSYGLQKGDHVNVIVSMLFVDLDTNWQSRLPNRTGLLIAPGPMNEDQSSITAIISSGEAYTNTPLNAANSYVGRIEIEPAANSPMWVIQGEEQRPRLVSQTLIQDVMILQMGYFGQAAQSVLPATDATPQPATGTEGEAAATPTTGPDVVTLVVTPQDAVTLNYLLLSGAKLNMVLRSAGDTNRVDTEAVTLQFLMDQYRIPNPAKLPYGTEPRVDNFPDYVPMFPEPGPSPTPAQ